jgi:hypothetical protein
MGRKELGLGLKEEIANYLTFECRRGFVTAKLGSEEGKTRLDLVMCELKYQGKRFASEIG